MFQVTAGEMRKVEHKLVADYRELLKHYKPLTRLYLTTGLANPIILSQVYCEKTGVQFADTDGVMWLISLYSTCESKPIHDAYVCIDAGYLHFTRMCLDHNLLDAL